MKTFYFDTGVRPYAHTPPVPVTSGYVLRGTMQIPFNCEGVPDGAFFKFAADDPTLGKGLHCAEILPGSAMVSKYAFFQIPTL